jgi:hypothetical protein
VSYPLDPDWPAGTVSKTITYQFDQGTSHLLVKKQQYDHRNGTDDGAADMPFPIEVSPGAEVGGMPKNEAGDTPRLVLLALGGDNVWGPIAVGDDEPTRDPALAWTRQDGQWSQTSLWSGAWGRFSTTVRRPGCTGSP